MANACRVQLLEQSGPARWWNTERGLTTSLKEQAIGCDRPTYNLVNHQPPRAVRRRITCSCYMRVTSSLPRIGDGRCGKPCAASVRSLELNDAIRVIGKSVIARPIASFSDIVDRAILAAWACQPHDGELVPDDVGGLQGAYIVDVLALAGSAMWNLRLRSVLSRSVSVAALNWGRFFGRHHYAFAVWRCCSMTDSST